MQLHLNIDGKKTTLELNIIFFSKQFTKTETTSILGAVQISVPYLTSLSGLQIFKTKKEDGEVSIWIAEKAYKTTIKGKTEWKPDFRLLKGFKELVQLVVEKEWQSTEDGQSYIHPRNLDMLIYNHPLIDTDMYAKPAEENAVIENTQTETQTQTISDDEFMNNIFEN